MKTLGDVLNGVNETYGILLPYLKEENRYDFEMILYDSPDAFQIDRKLLRTNAAQNVLGSTNIIKMEEIYKTLAESLAFNKPVERLSLIKERYWNSLNIEFKDGLCISAHNYPRTFYRLERHYQINPKSTPKLRFRYEVNPKNIFTARSTLGFKLKPEQIPENLFYPHYAGKMLRYGNWGEEAIIGATVDEVSMRLGKRAAEIFEGHYKDVQRDLQDGKKWFDITIEHMPSSYVYPNGIVLGESCYNPHIDKDSDILDKELSQVTSRFDKIEYAVRDLYKNLNIEELEDFETLPRFT
jgi:hypothetical protein